MRSFPAPMGTYAMPCLHWSSTYEARVSGIEARAAILFIVIDLLVFHPASCPSLYELMSHWCCRYASGPVAARKEEREWVEKPRDLEPKANAKDEFLDTLHALGKLLYAKRKCIECMSCLCEKPEAMLSAQGMTSVISPFPLRPSWKPRHSTPSQPAPSCL